VMNVTMGANFEMMYGLRTPGGYDFRLRRTSRILTALHSPRGSNVFSAKAIAATPPYGIFDLLGARFLLATASNSSATDLERDPGRLQAVFRDHSVCVFENSSALPRAFFMPAEAVRRYAREEQEAEAVLAPSFDARRTLVLPGGSATGTTVASPAALVPAEGFTESPGKVSFVADAPVSGFAVVSESAYPGWRAWVDGRSAVIVRADYAFQGVAVGPGRHRVVLRYVAPIFWSCLFVSSAGWLGLAVFVLVRRARSRSVPADPGSGAASPAAPKPGPIRTAR